MVYELLPVPTATPRSCLTGGLQNDALVHLSSMSHRPVDHLWELVDVNCLSWGSILGSPLQAKRQVRRTVSQRCGMGGEATNYTVLLITVGVIGPTHGA